MEGFFFGRNKMEVGKAKLDDSSPQVIILQSNPHISLRHLGIPLKDIFWIDLANYNSFSMRVSMRYALSIPLIWFITVVASDSITTSSHLFRLQVGYPHIFP